MDSPVAKIIMLAATIAITAAVVLFTWQVVGSNTPDPHGRSRHRQGTDQAREPVQGRRRHLDDDPG